jgi:Domain of unknown function (DUF4396)
MIVGTAAGFSNLGTIVLSVALAFVFGYGLTSLPLLKAGMALAVVVPIAFASDTLSIATMEVVDNLVMAVIPGAMDAGLVNVVFWVGMMIALTAAFFAAYPVNRYLLQRGKGHALLHEHHQGGTEAVGVRRLIPSFATSTLVAVLVAFMLGGLVVSIADEAGGGPDEAEHASSAT